MPIHYSDDPRYSTLNRRFLTRSPNLNLVYDQPLIHPSQDFINIDLMGGPLSAKAEEMFWSRRREIETNAERSLAGRLGMNYEYDPFNIRLSDLSTDDRDKYISQLDMLRGLRTDINSTTTAEGLLEQGVGPVMFRDYVKPGPGDSWINERSPAGRMRFSRKDIMNDPRALDLTQSTIRFDRSRIGNEFVPEDRYHSAGTVYRTDVLQHVRDLLSTNIETKGNTLIFDVETPSLNPAEGIWQLSARMIRDNGDIEDKTFHFHNPKMQWGGVVGDSRQSLEQFLSEGSNIQDYPEGLKDFFKWVGEADYVGGHNIFFDYGMIARGLKKHSSYTQTLADGRPNPKYDPEFSRGVDTFLAKFWDREHGKFGNVVDTQALARAVIPEINLAPELEGSFSPYAFSLQNILLQTNLMERVRATEGDETVNKWLQRGLHYADVDVPFEAHLLTALQEHSRTGEGLKLARSGESFLSPSERQAILSSRAIGPSIPMSNWDLLDKSLFERVAKAGLIDMDSEGNLLNIHMTPMAQMVALGRNFSTKTKPQTLFPLTEKDTVWDRLAAADWRGAAARLKSLFWDYDPEKSALQISLRSAGTWQRMSAYNQRTNIGFITKGGLIAQYSHTPSLEEWAERQKEFEDAGIPMPGMHWLERHMSSLFGTATSYTEGAERTTRHVLGADIASLGKFVAAPEVNVVGKSKMAVIPMHILEAWEQERLNTGEKVSTGFTRPDEIAQFLYAYPFSPDVERRKDEIALMVNLDETEKRSLLNYLRATNKTSPDILDSIEESFKATSGTYGVQVGLLGNLKGSQEISKIAASMRQVMGIGAGESDQTPMIYLPYAGRDVLEDETPQVAKSIYTMGAVLHKDLLTPEDLTEIPTHIQQGRRIYKEAVQNAGRTKLMQAFDVLASRGAEGEALKITPAMIGAYEIIRKRSPIIAAASVIGGVSYYEHRKHNREAEFDPTFDRQPYENPRDNQNPIAINSVRKNPLDTAGVMRILHNRRTNHNIISNAKNSYLFGGYQQWQ